MRTITTYTTRQIATGIANAEAQDADVLAGNATRRRHSVQATDEHVDRVKSGLDKVARLLGFDKDELRGDQPATLQDRYLDRKAAGIDDAAPVADVTL